MDSRRYRQRLQDERRELGLRSDQQRPKPDDLLQHAREHEVQVTEREHRRSWSVWDEALDGWRYICKGCGASFTSGSEVGGHVNSMRCPGPYQESRAAERRKQDEEWRFTREAAGEPDPEPEPEPEPDPDPEPAPALEGLGLLGQIMAAMAPQSHQEPEPEPEPKPKAAPKAATGKLSRDELLASIDEASDQVARETRR